MNRRNFVIRSAVLTAGPSLLKFSDAFATNALSGDYLTFDLHCHPGMFFAKGVEGFSVDAGVGKTLSEMKTGKLTGAFFSLVADAKIIKVGSDGVKPSRSFAPGEAWKDYKRQLIALKEFITNDSYFSLATQGTDLQKNFDSKDRLSTSPAKVVITWKAMPAASKKCIKMEYVQSNWCTTIPMRLVIYRPSLLNTTA
jgi:hypothetical protein